MGKHRPPGLNVCIETVEPVPVSSMNTQYSPYHLTDHLHVVLIFCTLHILEGLFDEIILLSACHSEACADLLSWGLGIIVDRLEYLPFTAAAILNSNNEDNTLQI